VVEIYPKIEGKYCRDYDWTDTGSGYCKGGTATRIYDGEDNPGDTAALKTEFCALGCYKRNVEHKGGKKWEDWDTETQLTHFAVKPSGRCICYGGTCTEKNGGGWDLYEYNYSNQISRVGYA
jgi:hypothetical protein